MKKVFCIALLGVLSMTGCANSNEAELQKQLDDANQQISVLQAQVSSESSESSDRGTDMNNMMLYECDLESALDEANARLKEAGLEEVEKPNYDDYVK